MRNITRTLMVLVAAAGLMLSTGCKSDCEKAVDNMFSIMDAELKDAPEAQKEAMKKGVEEMKNGKDKLLEECAKQTPEDIKCSTEAKSMADMRKCGKGK
ncbi:MAG: bacterioferritin-associated ferredoxin [Myxococcota bacterium]|jgi:bacterioferritin-associated ferredoxin